MKRVTSTILFAPAITALFVVTSCGSDSDDTAGEPAGSSESANDESEASPPIETSSPETASDPGDVCTDERVGGSITMGMYTETRGLDPVVSTGSGATGGTEMAAIYDTIMEWDPSTGEYEPRLAESLEPNDDYSTWTLTLKPDLEFGNGDPYTTAAVAASIDRHKDPESESTSLVFAEQVERMEIVDDRTMDFHLVEPWVDFPYVLADEPGMVPNPAVLEDLDPEEFNHAPVGAGAGPYEVTRFAPGEEITMEAKDDYWGGPVCIQQLRFVAPGQADATYDSFTSGQFEVAFIDDARVLDEARTAGVNAHSDTLGGQGILINNGVGDNEVPTSDVDVRKAILHALDTEVIDQRVNDGAGEATSALFGEASLYHSPDVSGVAHDPEAATELVEDVTTRSAWDGSVRLTCTSAQTEEALAVAGLLEAAGFTVEQDIVATTTDLVQKVIVEPDYELACWSVQLFDAAPWIKLHRFLHSDSPANRIGYANPAMDSALDDLRVADSLQDTQEVIVGIQEIWNETAPSAILRAGAPTVIWSDDVHGLTFTQETMVYFDEAYLDG